MDFLNNAKYGLTLFDGYTNTGEFGAWNVCVLVINTVMLQVTDLSSLINYLQHI